MKRILLYTLFLLFCAVQCKSQDISKRKSLKDERTAFYTVLDSVKIITQNFDTLTFSKFEFNQIIDSLPCLYNQDIIDDPDISYNSRTTKNTFLDKNGDIFLSFNSEAGQDEYYILYAYFLKQKVGEKKYATRRTTLTQVYNIINRIFSRLNNGGTYFGHQYKRIIGYTEYSLYWYSEREDFFSKKYDIKPQKELFLNSLRQVIKDETSVDGGTIGNYKVKKQKELNEMVNNLDKLITDAFYLKRAQAFQYSYY